MAVSVKHVTLWRREVENRPGLMADTLEALANAGVDLQAVMGYRYPGDPFKAAIEVFPISDQQAATAAQAGGLSPTTIPTLLVEGPNQAGLGHAISKAIAEAGINMSFLVAQVVEARYSAIFGFENEMDARVASDLITRVARMVPEKKPAGKKKAAKKKAAKKKAAKKKVAKKKAAKKKAAKKRRR